MEEEDDDQVNKGKKDEPEKVGKKDENRMIKGTRKKRSKLRIRKDGKD